jgi:O-antigen/teichoic acid export membrane protein
MDRQAAIITNDTPRWRPDTLAVSVAVLLAVNLIQRTIGFGRGVLFCRWLSPDELGQWEMAYSFLLLAAPVVVLGLPGSFGRYLERYRQRGQLRAFLRRASVWTAVLSGLALMVLLAAQERFSNVIFGRPDRQWLVLLLAVSLAAVILHHFLEALFAALRKFRIVSTMHFFQSLLFALISLSLLWCWRSAAESIIVGYGLACLASAVGALVWNVRGLADLAPPGEAPSHGEFWPPLMRFAVWVWVTNMLCQLFAVIDRYMLVHYSGLDSVAALAEVGHYHASRILPLLFLSIADLLSGVVLPYLSHDWEAGRRERVSQRLNLVLKFSSLATLAGGIVVMAAAPLLFHVAFEGRYDGGFAVLPFTLTYCSWYGLLLVAQTYLWCAERMKTGLVPLACGLVVNTVCNYFLIPHWGLKGAVVSTTLATGLALTVLYAINHRTGMKLDAGVALFSLSLGAMCGGVWVAVVALVVLVAVLPWSKTLLTDEERSTIAQLVTEFRIRISELVIRRSKQSEATFTSRAAALSLSRGRKPTEA